MINLKVEAFSTDNSITLYWNKTEEICKTDIYQILVNGRIMDSTSTTHATIQKLNEQSLYDIMIQRVRSDGSIEEQSDTLAIATEKRKERIDITKAPYYAVGDGKTLNTECMQKALDDCDETQVVYIPAGTYLSGALRMHSNMELYIEKEGILQGTANPMDYLPKIKSRFEGTEMMCYSSLLNLGDLDHESGYNCDHVIIHGGGTIAGGGRELAQKMIDSERKKLEEYIASLGDEINTYENMDTIPGRVRSRLINMSNCQNIRISDVTLKDGASWNVHMIYSDNILTNNCNFYSKGIWNGDGWDPDSSTNCTIFGCEFYTQDDSIAIKSGKNPEGNIINRPSKHIRIFDCKCAFGHGVALGSEMSGGIEDVQIWDCDLRNSAYGIQIKGTKKRGGYVRDIHVRDTMVSRVLFQAVSYNDDGISADKPPVFENCTFKNMLITGKYLNMNDMSWVNSYAIELSGFKEKGHQINNILFQDIQLTGNEEELGNKILMQQCKHITFQNIDQKIEI